MKHLLLAGQFFAAHLRHRGCFTRRLEVTAILELLAPLALGGLLLGELHAWGAIVVIANGDLRGDDIADTAKLEHIHVFAARSKWNLEPIVLGDHCLVRVGEDPDLAGFRLPEIEAHAEVLGEPGDEVRVALLELHDELAWLVGLAQRELEVFARLQAEPADALCHDVWHGALHRDLGDFAQSERESARHDDEIPSEQIGFGMNIAFDAMNDPVYEAKRGSIALQYDTSSCSKERLFVDRSASRAHHAHVDRIEPRELLPAANPRDLESPCFDGVGFDTRCQCRHVEPR